MPRECNTCIICTHYFCRAPVLQPNLPTGRVFGIRLGWYTCVTNNADLNRIISEFDSITYFEANWHPTRAEWAKIDLALF